MFITCAIMRYGIATANPGFSLIDRVKPSHVVASSYQVSEDGRAMRGETVRGQPTSWQVLRDASILLIYTMAFVASHRIAAIWGGDYFYYSLLYPAAGMRLALLWHCGPRWTPAVIASECVAQMYMGGIAPHDPDVLRQTLGIIRPPIIYGLVVWLARSLERRKVADLSTPPMPFGLALVLAPIAHALSSMAGGLAMPGLAHVPSAGPPVAATVALLLGDLLGCLLFAPVLLWLPLMTSRNYIDVLPAPVRMIEASSVFALACTASLFAEHVTGSLMLLPVLLAVTWVGLRCGRNVTWVFIIFASAIILPLSITTIDSTRLELHSMLIAIAIIGYLAGSFTDAQRRAQADIARRDRMLLQAERLKTLRAMSVAVIHEVSQPLTTLAIEAKQLVALGANPATNRHEIAESSVLIERKVDALANMVRRLRHFGGRAIDEPSPIPVAALFANVTQLARTEAQSKGVTLVVTAPDEAVRVMGQEVELTQALVNIVRNAIAAAAPGLVHLEATKGDGEIAIRVANHHSSAVRDYPGMGIGTMIANAIIAAHGGRLMREDAADGAIVHLFHLPQAGDHGD